MATKDEPSYADLVYEVCQSAGRPQSFQEIFDAVNQRRPVTTRNPKATIRNALSQAAQLIGDGHGRYGYLPHLLKDSVLRLPLFEEHLASHRLIYPWEVLQALWPDFFETEKRKLGRPVQVALSNRDEAVLTREIFGQHGWGSAMPARLTRYLAESRARTGDSLLVRVVDAEAGRYEAEFESQLKRDEAGVAGRNRDLAGASYDLFYERRSDRLYHWELAIALLARRFYHSDVAPDSLQQVLSADPRFVDGGLKMWMLAGFVTPDEEISIEMRKRLQAELFQARAEEVPDLGEAVPPLRYPYAMERTMDDIGALLSGREFESIEDANAFLTDTLAQGDLPHRAAETPLEKAQDLMYDAWESNSSRERVRLARQALKLSPDCADAYALLADETARSPEEAVDLYEKAVAAGARFLGKEGFEQNVGSFWGVLETRPYMRVRFGLAAALWSTGKGEEAIEHLWDMLRLNPNDNQGARYVLLNWLLELGSDAQVEDLLDRYPDDAAAAWLYGRALHAFRSEGDKGHARSWRTRAKKENRHVAAYLVGRKPLPNTLPDLIGVGDEREAILCAAEQMEVWRKTPGALAWLDAH